MMSATVSSSLRRPAIWLAALLTILLSVSIGYAVYLTKFDSDMQKLAAEHNYILGKANRLLNAELGDVRNSTRLLSAHLRDLLNSQSSRRSVDSAIARVGLSHPSISQLRWLSETGMELHRVNFSNGKSSIVNKDSLQNKQTRYYFTQAKSLRPGELALSPIDLNVENGAVQIPYTPTIRGIYKPITNHPLGNGYFIANFALVDLFENLSNIATARSHLVIAEGDDRWILHYETEKEWAPDLSNEPHNIMTDKPAVFREFRHRPSISLYQNEHNDIYSGIKSSLNAGSHQNATSLYFLVKTEQQFFSELVRQAMIPAISVALFVMLLGGLYFLREIRNKLALEQLSQQLALDKQQLATSLEQQKLLQDELIESEKMASLGILVAGVSHELNTPLGSAILSVSGIQKRTAEITSKLETGLTRKELEHFLSRSADNAEIALTNLNRSAELIKRFKRLAVDRGDEVSAHFKLNLVLDDLSRSITPLVKSNRVTLELSVPSSISMLSYPGIISQVVQNLIVNCLDHAFAEQKNPRIWVVATLQNNRVTLKVKDNGRGIDESVLPRLFDPFITTARGKGNTGLGLHLVHQWVTMVLEGQITVESSATGTTFTLTFPRNVSIPATD